MSPVLVLFIPEQEILKAMISLNVYADIVPGETIDE